MASYKQYAGSKPASLDLSWDFDRLTAKQHEVFRLVAEGRTTKEIAWRLNVTDSAINQRIEAVRSRVGSPPRAELARAYRGYLATQIGEAEPAVTSLPPFPSPPLQSSPSRNADAFSAGYAMRGSREDDARSFGESASLWIVPRSFTGPNAGLNRGAAIVIIAAGMLASSWLALEVMRVLQGLN
jgi:DNA-binding CsgD family transcriptional regulator